MKRWIPLFLIISVIASAEEPIVTLKDFCDKNQSEYWAKNSESCRLVRGEYKLDQLCDGYAKGNGRLTARLSVLHGINPRAYPAFWKGPENLRLRSRWLQQGQYPKGKEVGREECWYCSDWESEVVSVGENVGSDPPRAGPGRGRDWKRKIKKIWLQQTQCEIHDGNGNLRSALVSGVQYGQSIAEIKSSGYANSVKIAGLQKIPPESWIIHSENPEN